MGGGSLVEQVLPLYRLQIPSYYVWSDLSKKNGNPGLTVISLVSILTILQHIKLLCLLSEVTVLGMSS